MPKVTEAHRSAMRERIRGAALAEFVSRGVRATSMADILGRCRLSAGAVYGYYASKDDLVIDVARHVVDGKLMRLRECRQRRPLPDPVTVVRGMLEDAPGEGLDTGLVLQLWSEALVSPRAHDVVGDFMRAIRAELRLYLVDWFADHGGAAGAAERADRLTPALLGLAQGGLVHRSLCSPAEQQAYFEGVAALVAAATAHEEPPSDAPST